MGYLLLIGLAVAAYIYRAELKAAWDKYVGPKFD
jgi:hypothetical protein